MPALQYGCITVSYHPGDNSGPDYSSLWAKQQTAGGAVPRCICVDL